jgi:DNA polymerase
MKKEERDNLLLQIKNELLALNEGELAKVRRETKMFPVIGEGSHVAQIMFVGEAPGKNEAATGRPFCGAAGKVLTAMVEHVGLKREDVYITNIVKDRPPDNRDPLPQEIEIYSSFLDRQIDIIQPKVIATLGRYSMPYIMNKFGLGGELKPISQMHGKVFETKASYGNVKIITLYHPAVALYNGGMREQLFKDFEIVKQHI